MLKDNKSFKKICILGDGGWGTTLALLLQKKGHFVTVWGAFEDYVNKVDEKRINFKFLPKIKIPKAIKFTSNLKEALWSKDIIIVAVPSSYLRSVLKRVKKTGFPRKAIYLSVTKGIEISSLKRMSQIIYDELRVSKIAVLSGPTIAIEVARHIPTTAVISCESLTLRKYLQKIFMSERFRVYTNSDITGTELGGSLKNIIAIACGISDGLGFGTNTKAAILTRGLAEIARLGIAMGAKPKTFFGISGLGDLVTTCISPFSRNRSFGEQVGKGKKLKELEKKLSTVAEGIPTAKAAFKLSKKYNVDMPITRQINAVLFRNKPALAAVKELMLRKEKEE